MIRVGLIIRGRLAQELVWPGIGRLGMNRMVCNDYAGKEFGSSGHCRVQTDANSYLPKLQKWRLMLVARCRCRNVFKFQKIDDVSDTT